MFDKEHRSVGLNEIRYGSSLVTTEMLHMKIKEGAGHWNKEPLWKRKIKS